jgi:hypothetical protein
LEPEHGSLHVSKSGERCIWPLRVFARSEHGAPEVSRQVRCRRRRACRSDPVSCSAARLRPMPSRWLHQRRSSFDLENGCACCWTAKGSGGSLPITRPVKRATIRIRRCHRPDLLDSGARHYEQQSSANPELQPLPRIAYPKFRPRHRAQLIGDTIWPVNEDLPSSASTSLRLLCTCSGMLSRQLTTYSVPPRRGVALRGDWRLYPSGIGGG